MFVEFRDHRNEKDPRMLAHYAESARRVLNEFKRFDKWDENQMLEFKS